MPVPLNKVELTSVAPQLHMISAASCRQDYVGFNVIVNSGCSSYTFNCLNYIYNFEVMIEEDHSLITSVDWTRVQKRGKGTCGVLDDDYYVSEISNCLLSVHQMDHNKMSLQVFAAVYVK